MLKNKKNITVFGLSAFAIILVVVLMAMSQPAKQTDTLNDTDMQTSGVTPSEIADTAPIAITPEVKPSEIVTPEPTAEAKANVPLTVIEDKPEPPELPDTAHSDEPHDEPTDPALTNPEVKPSVTPKPVESTKPKETTPQGGDTNSKGEVYVPGFGWIVPSTAEGEKSVGEGSLDVMVGH